MKYIKRRLILAYPEESLAHELTTKVAEAFEARGFDVIANMGKLGEGSEEYGVNDYQIGFENSFSELEIGSKYIFIRNVWRRNGTEKNVSTEIELIQRDSQYSSRRIERVKIAKGSGEKAINNKINKILEKL